MRYILAVVLLASVGLAEINWTWNGALAADVEQAWTEFVEAYEIGCADSIEFHGEMFEMLAAVQAYYRQLAISRWGEFIAAVDTFEAHATGQL